MDKTSTCTFHPYFFELASRKGFYYFFRTASPQSYILFRLIPITLPAVLNTIAYGSSQFCRRTCFYAKPNLGLNV
ncbi:hypothetical protein BDZ89DRAFT_1072880, partial [Hymenopellis radicata]